MGLARALDIILLGGPPLKLTLPKNFDYSIKIVQSEEDQGRVGGLMRERAHFTSRGARRVIARSPGHP